MTLVEAIGMTVLIGVMASLAFPAINGLRAASLDQQAIGVAQSLNQAQQTYLLRNANAAALWSAAANDEAKYELIESYVPYAQATLAAYTPTGYTITMGTPTLNQKVGLTGPSGSMTY